MEEKEVHTCMHTYIHTYIHIDTVRNHKSQTPAAPNGVILSVGFQGLGLT